MKYYPNDLWWWVMMMMVLFDHLDRLIRISRATTPNLISNLYLDNFWCMMMELFAYNMNFLFMNVSWSLFNPATATIPASSTIPSSTTIPTGYTSIPATNWWTLSHESSRSTGDHCENTNENLEQNRMMIWSTSYYCTLLNPVANSQIPSFW